MDHACYRGGRRARCTHPDAGDLGRQGVDLGLDVVYEGALRDFVAQVAQHAVAVAGALARRGDGRAEGGDLGLAVERISVSEGCGSYRTTSQVYLRTPMGVIAAAADPRRAAMEATTAASFMLEELEV